MGRFQSGQMGRTVNPLAYAFVGSIPTRPTTFFFLSAQVVELVDTMVLEAIALRCKSSSLFLGTTKLIMENW